MWGEGSVMDLVHTLALHMKRFAGGEGEQFGLEAGSSHGGDPSAA
jgi:hypothetical protein